MAYPNWETPLQGLIAQQQNPLTNLSTPVPQQAQPGFMDQFQGFTQTPQGQQALLAFANAALQNNMNPMMGGGAGFIGAMGSGMQGYKAADEMETRKARRAKTEAHEDVMMPLEEQKLAAEIENYKKPEAGAYKVGQTREMETNLKDGRKVKYKEQFQGGNVLDPKAWKTISAQVDNPAPKEAKPLDMLNYQEIAAGIVKHPSISPQAAQSLIDLMARSPYGRRQAAAQSAMKDDRWILSEGNPVARNSLIDEYESYLTPVKNPGIVDVTGERQKAIIGIQAAKGDKTKIDAIKALYKQATGQDYK